MATIKRKVVSIKSKISGRYAAPRYKLRTRQR